jgi:hypothetical protein
MPVNRDLEAAGVYGSLTYLPSPVPEGPHGTVARVQLSRRPAEAGYTMV